jgi:hypothetical protein
MGRILTGFLLAATLATIGHSAMAQQPLDGDWTVEALPGTGACTRVHRYTVRISNGSVRNAGREKVSVTGGLDASGNIKGSARRSKTRVDVTGSLSDRSGSGDWTMAGRVNCSGRWRAEKRA